MKILRGTAAVREKYRLHMSLELSSGKTDDMMKPEPEDLLEICRDPDGISGSLRNAYRKYGL